MSMMTMTDRRRSPGWWIPWTFVGFFGVVLIANGIMLTVALNTFTGLETTDAYERGLAYNDKIAEARAQSKLGWTVNLTTRPSARQTVDVIVSAFDRAGNIITGAKATAAFLRPTMEGYDFETPLPSEGVNYVTTVDVPLPGQWDVRLTIEKDGETFKLYRRIIVH